MESHQNTFIARQAILDSALNTVGYELLFRDNQDSLAYLYNKTSPEKATAKVILQNHILGDLSSICFDKKAFINFDEITLLQNAPMLFSANSIVVEIVETTNISDELVFKLSQLHKKGYLIALDDYDFSIKWECLFPYISMIKVDIEQIPFNQIKGLKIRLQNAKSNIKLTAERIETLEQYLTFKALGVDYFQGYFFHKPEMKSGICVPPLKLNLIQLFLEIYKPNLDFEQLAQIISRDVTLVSGILKLVNNASECGQIEIVSIKQAITYLGTNKIKQYVAIISMSTLSSESPSELFNESLIRAKMMELISEDEPFSTLTEMAFLTGILSNIDAILNVPMAEVLRNISLSKEIRLALLDQDGALYDLLTLAKYYEAPNSSDIESIHNISASTLLTCYQNSLKWWGTIT